MSNARKRLYELITNLERLTDEQHSELLNLIILHKEEFYRFNEADDYCYLDEGNIYINKEIGEDEENK